MKIYRIKKRGEELYFSTNSMSWVEEGAVFSNFKVAKKNLARQKAWITRCTRYYSSDSPTSQRYRTLAADLNECSIVEYDIVKVKEYDGQGVEINSPIGPDILEAEKENNFDKIDFANI